MRLPQKLQAAGFIALGCLATMWLQASPFFSSSKGGGVRSASAAGGGASALTACRDSPPAPARAAEPGKNDAYLSGPAVAARLYTREGMHPLSVLSLNPARLAPATHAAQTLIWQTQHPDDCASARFVVSNGHWHPRGNGIGAIMHVTGTHLGGAVEKGAVFLFNERSGEEWTDETTCGSVRNWECFFRAPSHCTLEHVTPTNSDVDSGPRFLPAAFRDMLYAAVPDMTEDAAKYWWRAQSVAYLMRLNDMTLAAVRALRTDALLIGLSEGSRLTPADVAKIPLPSGAIHAHVRHGDKYTEMLLQGTARYTNASIALTLAQPFTLRRILYISTEDSNVPAEAGVLLAKKDWTVLHYGIRRSNTGPLTQIKDLGEGTAGNTTRTHLQQLVMSMEADAWVGTRGSNWNRLLDELRCVWVDKCGLPYTEVGTDESWEGYNW